MRQAATLGQQNGIRLDALSSINNERVRSGVQAVFIPSLSLFMLTRLIGGNRVITLGTAVEQHFLVTQNWEWVLQSGLY